MEFISGLTVPTMYHLTVRKFFILQKGGEGGRKVKKSNRLWRPIVL
jgi:hypothetical protein